LCKRGSRGETTIGEPNDNRKRANRRVDGKQRSLIGPDGLVKELTRALVELMLAGGLNHHLGCEKHEVAGYGTGNSRSGKSQKTLKGEAGEMTIEVPRDRNGTFEPKLIEKHQTRFEGFDAKILSMYALGMTVRDIQGHLHDMYGWM
jgi:putative transposase